MPRDPKTASRRKGVPLKAIAVFKLAKATLLVVIGLGSLELTRPGAVARAEEWLGAMALRTGEAFPLRVVAWIARTDPARFDAIGVGAFLYAALYATEGVGLWLRKRWAEYLVIIATSSFVPFEIYELTRRLTGTRVSALVINIGVLVYLIMLVRKERREHAHTESPPSRRP